MRGNLWEEKQIQSGELLGGPWASWKHCWPLSHVGCVETLHLEHLGAGRRERRLFCLSHHLLLVAQSFRHGAFTLPCFQEVLPGPYSQLLETSDAEWGTSCKSRSGGKSQGFLSPVGVAWVLELLGIPLNRYDGPQTAPRLRRWGKFPLIGHRLLDKTWVSPLFSSPLHLFLPIYTFSLLSPPLSPPLFLLFFLSSFISLMENQVCRIKHRCYTECLSTS